MSSRQRKLAEFLTSLGYAIVPSGADGQHFSTLPAWQGNATTTMTVVDRWLAEGYSYTTDHGSTKTIPVTEGQLWVCVAKSDGVGCLDIDDLQACIDKGMPPLPDNVRKISTPSGGLHVPFKHTDATRRGSGCVRLSDDPKSPDFKVKILEFKSEAAAWCAENQTRIGDEKHPAGSYTPINTEDIMVGIPADLLEWLDEHHSGSTRRQAATIEWKFVDDWDEAEFLEHNHCEALGDSYTDNGTTYVPVAACPVCDNNCRAMKRGAQCKFIFSGKGYGYTCKFCGLEGDGATARFKELMAAKYPEWEPWSEPIYEQAALDFAVLDIESADDDDKVLTAEDVKKLVEQAKTEKADDPKVYAETGQAFKKADEPALEADESALAIGVKQGKFAWSVNIIKASDVKMERMEWLWPGRIPATKITLFVGKGDCGKSMALLDTAFRVSTGTDWPDGEKNAYGPRRVLMAMSEDDLSDTVVPRLTAAGANLNMIEFLKDITVVDKNDSRKVRGLKLKEDIGKIKKSLAANPDIAVLAFDAISSYFGGGDSNKDADMRPILEAMARMCAETKTAILGIIHYNKNSELDAVQKILGAGSIGHVTRAIWSFSRNPENKLEYFMAKAKGNLAKVGRGGMTYTIEDAIIKIDGKDVTQPRVNWVGENDMDASAVAQHARECQNTGVSIESFGPDSKVGKARLLITSKLEKGRQRTPDVYKAAEQEGISDATMLRAARSLGVKYTTETGGEWKKGSGPCYWELPNPVVEKAVELKRADTLGDVKEL